MTMFRVAALPTLALVLVAAVLGVEFANGGGEFAPLRSADPCAARAVTSVSTGINGLTEQLVLLGLDGAACRLQTSREALTLKLAQSGTPTDAEIDAIRAGLQDAVDRMQADDAIPPASDLADEALDSADLNGFVKAAIRALPDSLIDKAFDTGDVLRRTIDDLDLRELLANLDDPDDLNSQLNDAVTQAIKDSLADRLDDLL